MMTDPLQILEELWGQLAQIRLRTGQTAQYTIDPDLRRVILSCLGIEEDGRKKEDPTFEELDVGHGVDVWLRVMHKEIKRREGAIVGD